MSTTPTTSVGFAAEVAGSDITEANVFFVYPIPFGQVFEKVKETIARV